MKTLSFIFSITFFICLLTFGQAWAGEVKITNVQDNFNKGKYEVLDLEEGTLFFTNREYLVTVIPEKYLGMTFIRTANDPVNQDQQREFEISFDIDREADIYVAYDSRIELNDPAHDWIKNDYIKTGDDVTLAGAGHAPTPWNVYKSKKSFPKGTVKTYGGAWTMYIIFVDAAGVTPAVNPSQKLTSTWGRIKM